MKREEKRREWSALSEGIMDGIGQWREQNPKATFREIEDEIDRRLSELRAQILSDTANQSAQARWEAAEGVVCPECGAKLVKKGRKKRTLLTRDGRAIELERDYAVCPGCGQGIFPPG
ncbi:MAG TPA: YgiT-type zinc finger protein [Candidatus Paceibacterota bacterium]